MFNSPVLDIVIGLIFIYLLYSLLVTIISELIATFLSLRARNLKEAVERMLSDEQAKFLESVKLAKNSKKNPVVNAFYNNPEIKYLGSSGLFKLPSTFDAASFAKTLLSLVAGKDPVDSETLKKKLGEKITIAGINEKGVTIEQDLDPDTTKYINDLWQEAQGDMEKFKLLLENWFNRTMQHTTEWYKRKIRVITLILGFLIAWFFNADTFVMVNKLSVDKDARDQIVSMANAYVQNHPVLDTTRITSNKELKNYNKQLDSLLAVKKQLQADISNTNTILGIGSFAPDSVKVYTDTNKVKSYVPPVEVQCLYCGEAKNGTIVFSFCDKVAYLFCLLWHHFWGFLVTAIAISLGAPFWFDLLSKFMKLKTSQSEDPKRKKTASSSENVSPLNRVG